MTATGVEDHEREYYDRLYSGFAQQHFAKPAVVAFRRHLVRRILNAAGASGETRILSLGSGTGDTELLLAQHVASVTGVELSAAGVDQSRKDAQAAGIRNVNFVHCGYKDFEAPSHGFDVVIAVFFLHHLPDDELALFPARLRQLLRPGGMFYSLDPSARRLSGAVGELLFPELMKKYQTEGERPLKAEATCEIFARQDFRARYRWYDFASTPLAGLLPSAAAIYHAARVMDEIAIRIPLIRTLSSNFEILAHRV